MYIISSKNAQPTGLIFQGIYDTLSYILILISFFIMIAVLYISFLCFPKPGGGESVSFVQIALHLFGSIWGQPFPSEVQSIGVSTQTSIYLFTFLNFVIATMYGSLVISKMTLRKESSPINTLEDLGAKPEIRAYILKHSFMEDSINNFKVLQDMKDEERINLISLSDFVHGGVFTNLRDRSHILIESKANFLFFRSKLEEKATYCLNDPSNYHFSKEILFSLYSGWLYRKKFELSGTINKNLMWLHAFGFTWNPKENAGIFSHNKFDYDCDFEDNGENPCSKYPSLKEDHRRLSLLHLHMIFKYLGFGLVLAFFAFVTEVAYFFIRPIFFSKCIYRLHI